MKNNFNAIKINHSLAGFAFCFMVCIAGCKKDNSKDLSSSKPLNKVMSAGDGRFDLLGYGYDVTGEYANLSSTRFGVIDVEKISKAEPNRINTLLGVQDDTEINTGSDAEAYSQKLSGKVNATFGLPLFKGVFSTSYHQSSSFSAKYSYASAFKTIKQKQLVLNVTNQSIKDNYLTETFKSDVNTLSVQDLVARYGTHVLTNIVLGAKLEVFYRSQTTSSNRSTGVEAGFTSNVLNKLFHFDVKTSFADSTIKSNSDEKIYYRTIGGDGSKGLTGDVKLDNSPQTITIGTWQSSCNASNAVLIQIGQDGYTPLYDLIQDGVKSAAVKTYIEQYLAASRISLLGDVPVYSYYNASATDHYLTTVNQPYVGGGFKNEGPQFYAFSRQMPGTVPVYSYYNAGATDHYFSILNQPSVGGGFLREGIMFYVYANNGPDLTPVFSYYNAGARDHYFTTINQPSVGGGFLNEGVQFYIP